jgi:hypothetical protein
MARRRWLSLAATIDCIKNFFTAASAASLQQVCSKSSPFGCGQQADGGSRSRQAHLLKVAGRCEALRVTVPCEKGNSKIVVGDSKSSPAGAEAAQTFALLVSFVHRTVVEDIFTPNLAGTPT